MKLSKGDEVYVVVPKTHINIEDRGKIPEEILKKAPINTSFKIGYFQCFVNRCRFIDLQGESGRIYQVAIQESFALILFSDGEFGEHFPIEIIKAL